MSNPYKLWVNSQIKSLGTTSSLRKEMLEGEFKEIESREFIEPLLESYFQYIKTMTGISTPKGEWIKINTPFDFRYGDRLEIFVKKEGENIIISDDGVVFNDPMGREKKEELKKFIKKSHLTITEGEEIIKTTNFLRFKIDFHNFVSTILKTSK